MEVNIYCIEDCDGLKYIGSTTRRLENRLYAHKYYKDCMSRELDLDNCKIYTLEVTDEEHRKVREQYWIDNTVCVNYQNTIFDKKEHCKKYYQDNKKKYEHYRETNRNKHKEYMKKYNQYTNSWGGEPRTNNNLLKIDLDIFI